MPTERYLLNTFIKKIIYREKGWEKNTVHYESINLWLKSGCYSRQFVMYKMKNKIYDISHQCTINSVKTQVIGTGKNGRLRNSGPCLYSLLFRIANGCALCWKNVFDNAADPSKMHSLSNWHQVETQRTPSHHRQ